MKIVDETDKLLANVLDISKHALHIIKEHEYYNTCLKTLPETIT